MAAEKKFFWNQSHNDFIQKVLRKARKGSKVTYVIGNHDEVLRKLDNLNLANISLVKEAVHTTLKRKKKYGLSMVINLMGLLSMQNG